MEFLKEQGEIIEKLEIQHSEDLKKTKRLIAVEIWKGTVKISSEKTNGFKLLEEF